MNLRNVAIPTLVTLLLGAAFAAAAATPTIRVTCEVRGARAKASVDGKGLAAGQYRGVIVSGGNTAQAPAEAPVAGEVEFDFDSSPADIREGATAIPGTFVVNGQVTGKVVDAAGNTVVSDTAACRIRRK